MKKKAVSHQPSAFRYCNLVLAVWRATLREAQGRLWGPAAALVWRGLSLTDNLWDFAGAVQNGHDLQRCWELAIDNQIGTGGPEAYVSVRYVWANVSHPRSAGQLRKRVEEFIFQLVSGLGIVERDKIPNVLKILQRIGRE